MLRGLIGCVGYVISPPHPPKEINCFLFASRLMFYLFDLCSAIKLRPKEGETYFDVVAVVDPVTREAQRLAPLLLVGTTAEAVSVICVTSYLPEVVPYPEILCEHRFPLVIFKGHWKVLQGILGRADVFIKISNGSENNLITSESRYKFG